MDSKTWLEIAAQTPTQLRLRWSAGAHTGATELAFQSPLTPQLASTLEEYVRDFRSWSARDRDAAATAERSLLTLGRALGSELVDPDYRLLELCQALEQGGLNELCVMLRADHAEVLAQPWELLILPDSPYTLAAAAAAFVRTPGAGAPFEQPARALACNAEAPLGYLRLDAAAPDAAFPGRISQTWKQFGWQGALHYRLAPNLPCAGERAFQLIHFSGELNLRAGEPQLQLADGSELGANEFLARARALGTELLLLEPCSPGAAADELALRALRSGIDNVVIMFEPVRRGWPSAWAELLLDQLGAGLGLQRAVVETRKGMQRRLLDARKGDPERGHAPEQWHALRHYSTRDVQLFERAQPQIAFESCEAYAAVRRSLFGFDASFLPPQAPDLGDRAALSCWRALQTQRVLLVEAPPGGGLTHALHRTALYARANAEVSRAYYWDFAREPFRVGDMLEMVAGTRGQTDPARVSEASVLAELASEPELFVLDNVHAAGERAAELLQFALRASQAGAYCLLGTHETLAADWPPGSSRLALAPLSEREVMLLLEHGAPHVLPFRAKLAPLLTALHGHPLLIRRVLSACREDDCAALVAEAHASYGAQVEPAAQLVRFYERRWSELEPHWRRLLVAWLPFGGLYLQLLMLAVDRPGGEKSALGRVLWTGLGAPAADSCASALARLQASGFVITQGAGASIDRSALAFLRAVAAEEAPGAHADVLAQLVSACVARLLEKRAQAAPDVLGQHLLSERAVVRGAIERALAAGAHVLAIRAFLRFHALMLRAQLTAEAGAWARGLVERAGATLYGSDDPALATCWLSLALRAELRPAGGALGAGMQRWFDALVHDTLRDHPQRSSLVPLAVTCLERFYDHAGDSSAYRAVAKAACDFHRAAGDTQALVPQLRALAAAEHVLGNSEERDRLEHELLDAIAYDAAPSSSELRRQTLAQLAGMRLRRADEPGAEALIERLERECSDVELNPPALALRGELALRRADWQLACECFCTLWGAAMSGKPGIDIDPVVQRMHELERKLGEPLFGEIYAQRAGAAPTPSAIGIRAT